MQIDSSVHTRRVVRALACTAFDAS